MRKILTFVLFISGLCVEAQPAFEGLIEMKMSTSDKPELGKTKLYFSSIGGRSETEMKFAPNMKPFKTLRIYKRENPDLYYVINEASATYSVTDLSAYKPAPKAEEQVSVKVIGSEKILNYNCTHCIISTKSGETEMWTTKELMDYDAYKKLNESDARSRNSSFAKALIEANAEGFPVKTLKKDGKGGTISIEMVKVEKGNLDKTLFEIPNGYTKTESPTTGLEGMMQEIKQMGENAMKDEVPTGTEVKNAAPAK